MWHESPIGLPHPAKNSKLLRNFFAGATAVSREKVRRSRRNFSTSDVTPVRAPRMGGFSLGHFLIQGGTSLREPINPKDDKSSGARRVHRVATRIRVKTSTIANSPRSPSRVERAFLPARAAEAAVGVPVPRSSSLSEGGLSKG
jgi:hypothetical protein